MTVIPYEPAHLAVLRIQRAQAYMEPLLSDSGYARELLAGEARTWMDGDVVLGCCGIVPVWPGRACGWALVSAQAGRCMTAITRAAEAFLDGCGHRRVESYVAPEFMAGRRWMRMLGFREEGQMRAFTPDGRDAVLFARVR